MVVDIDVVDDSGMGFVSPDAAKFSSESSKKVTRHLLRRIENDDNDFVREVEKVEDIIKGNTSKGESSNDGVKIGCSVEIYDGGIVAADLNEIGLSPKGYCKNFWDPLIAGDFGGSNVVNVVFNEDKIVEGLSKKKGPPTYFCNTGSYFNYFVEEKRHKKLRSQRIIILG
ncbi:hypothetical protein YC2023_033672 [Brassica napus]